MAVGAIVKHYEPAEVAASEGFAAGQIPVHPQAPPWLQRSIVLAQRKRVALGWWARHAGVPVRRRVQ